MARKKSNYNKRKVLRTKRRGKRKRTTKRRRSRKQGGASQQYTRLPSSLLSTAGEGPGNILPDVDLPSSMSHSEPAAPAAGDTSIHRPTQAQVRKPDTAQQETQERPSWGLGEHLSSAPSYPPAEEPEVALLPPLKDEEVAGGGTRLPNKLSILVQEEYTEIEVGDIIVPTEQYNQVQARFYANTNRPQEDVAFFPETETERSPPKISFFRVTNKPPPHSGDGGGGGGGGAGLPGMSTFKLTVLPVNKDLKPIATAQGEDVAWRGQPTNWVGNAGRRMVKLGPKAFHVLKYNWAFESSVGTWAGAAGASETIKTLNLSSGGRFGGWATTFAGPVILYADPDPREGGVAQVTHFNDPGEAVAWLSGRPSYRGSSGRPLVPTWEAYQSWADAAGGMVGAAGGMARPWAGEMVSAAGGMASAAGGMARQLWGAGSKQKPRKRRRRRRR